MAGSKSASLIHWVSNVGRAAIVVFVVFLVTVIIRVDQFVEITGTFLNNVGILKSPMMRFAEKTARSDFSDRLTRMAWRRWYWGTIAARRVVDQGAIPEIDHAWANYMNATAEWNAEIMIFIVGLVSHYNEERSRYFEIKILNSFVNFDKALGSLRPYLEKLRSSQSLDEAERSEIGKLFAKFQIQAEQLNDELYDFARCFDAKMKQHCRPVAGLGADQLK
jgi:hypothetical protein